MRTASMRALELLAREDPARAGDRRARRRRHVVHAGDQHAGSAARRLHAIEQRRQRDALPVGGADQAEVARVGVAGAFHQVAAARSRPAAPGRAARARPAPARRPATGQRPRRGKRLGRRGTHEELLIADRGLRIADCGEVGEQPRVEAVAEEASERWRCAPPGLPSGITPMRRAFGCLLRERGQQESRREEIARGETASWLMAKG